MDPARPLPRPSVDHLAAEFAARQHGVVTRAQLLAAGAAARTVDRRVATGRFRILHRGVYRVVPMDLPGTREMAAALACGPRALVSHSSAGVLWHVLPTDRRPIRVRVIVAGGHRRRPGLRVYRFETVAEDERALVDRIPVTSPARTLLDLASHLRARALEAAVAEAAALRLVTLEEVAAMADRHRGRAGAGPLLTAVSGEGGPHRTRSEAEERFLALVRRGEAPRPRVNTRVAGHEVDFFWPDHHLVVEVDGLPYHSSPRAQARDRRRDGDLVAAGLRVMRITWQDIVHRPEALLVRLGQALAAQDV